MNSSSTFRVLWASLLLTFLLNLLLLCSEPVSASPWWSGSGSGSGSSSTPSSLESPSSSDDSTSQQQQQQQQKQQQQQQQKGGGGARRILQQAGLSEDEITQVYEGKLVKRVLESSNERELGMGFAFLVQGVSPLELKEQFLTLQYKKKLDPNVKEVGMLLLSSSLSEENISEFEKLSLSFGQEQGGSASSSGLDAAKELLHASPGSELNLSEQEIAKFRKILEQDSISSSSSSSSGTDDHDAEQQRRVEVGLREMLLDRYRSYREKGLTGVSPYARGGVKQRMYHPGDDILKGTELSLVLKREAPLFHKSLTNYPKDRPKDLEESFAWTSFSNPDGTPNVSLTHRMGLVENQIVVFAERQYYTLRGFNSVQGFGGAFPIKNVNDIDNDDDDDHHHHHRNKGSLIMFTSRTSTDQVTGFGASAKRAIGVRMLGSIVTELLEKYRKEGGNDEL